MRRKQANIFNYALFAVIFFLCVVYHGHNTFSSRGNMLDGCYHVYLDMGTNLGVQIRKLYQPHLFPNATVLPVFEKYFGPIEDR